MVASRNIFSLPLRDYRDSRIGLDAVSEIGINVSKLQNSFLSRSYFLFDFVFSPHPSLSKHLYRTASAK